MCILTEYLDDLRICCITPITSLQTRAPLPPRPTSVIARLLRLALDIFDGVCQTPAFHPTRDFQALIHNATSLVLAPRHVDSHNGQEMDQSAIQSLLDLMNDSGLEWPGGFLDLGTDFSGGWEVEGTMRV